MISVTMPEEAKPLSTVYASSARFEPAGMPPLNPPEAVARCRRRETMLALLRLHGLPVLAATPGRDAQPLAEAAVVYRCRVYLFQNRVLGVWRTQGSGAWLHPPAAAREELVWRDVTGHAADGADETRIRRLAVRALYALGLDAGCVSLGGRHLSRPRVIDVDPDPLVTPDLAQAYIDARADYVRSWRQEQERMPRVVLGADPEFALRDAEGKMGIASRYLHQGGTVGCDSVRLRNGADASERPLAELRPAPDEDPRVLLQRIRQAMAIADRIIPSSLEWVAGGMPFAGYPIGGHIHFSGVSLNFHLISALDACLGLPLVLLEDEGCRRRRPRYGFLGDVREQPHGGFEYRTLPSWLVSPEIAGGVLALAKVVASSHWKLTALPLADVRLQRAYYLGDKEAVRPVVRQLLQDVRSLPLYSQYMRQLEPFFTRIFTGTAWPAGQDIRRVWGLSGGRGRKGAGGRAQQPVHSVI